MWAWMLEYYGGAGLTEYLRAQEEFGFDLHYICGLSCSPVALSCPECGPLPGVDYRREEHGEDGFTVVRRLFRTPAGELTDETRFPPPDPRYGIGPNPRRTEYLLKSPDDLPALRYLIPDPEQADLSYYFTTERQVGERGLVLGEIASPLCHRAGDVYPVDELMMAALTERAFFEELLDLFHQAMMAEVRHAVRAGVRHFFANWYYNSLSAGWSPRLWRECFAPQLAEMTGAVHAAGGTVNFYDDGKCMDLLEVLADCEIDVLQTLPPPPIGDVDLAEVKRRIGDRVCLMGYIDLLHVLRRGTPTSIDAAVREALEIAAPGGGFILGTSDSMRDGTPLENVRAYFAAARKYGVRA
jgi:hypothetical protein